MTPAAFENAAASANKLFKEKYIDLLDAGKDAKVLRLIMTSKDVYMKLLFDFLLQNAFFDAPQTIFMPNRAVPDTVIDKIINKGENHD